MTSVPYAQLTSRVAFIDPASSKTILRRTAANMAITTVGAYHEWIFVLGCWRGRVSAKEFIQQIATEYLTYRPSVMGCEANGMQVLFGDTADMILRAQGLKLPLMEVYQPTHMDKDARIRLELQPIIGTGRLFLDRVKHAGLIEEIVAFPHGRTKDGIDSLASAIRLLPQRTKEVTQANTREQLIAHLERIGMHARLIERRMEQWDHDHSQGLPAVVQREGNQGGNYAGSQGSADGRRGAQYPEAGPRPREG